jgi:hypothetical protein
MRKGFKKICKKYCNSEYHHALLWRTHSGMGIIYPDHYRMDALTRVVEAYKEDEKFVKEVLIKWRILRLLEVLGILKS